MRFVFQQEVDDLRVRLVEIAGLVADAIEAAAGAFSGRDIELAEQVIGADHVIDRAASELDALAIDVLARQQPVARDLRTVVAALRISASLERMGDLASHIAQLVRLRFPERVVPKSLRPTFAELGGIDIDVARMVVRLLETEDPELAEQITAQDDLADELHRSVMEFVVAEQPKASPSQIVDATLASRFYERFADHAVSIAKRVQYLHTGVWYEENDRR